MSNLDPVTISQFYEASRDFEMAKLAVAHQAIDSFTARGTSVSLIGSAETAEADLFSDVDLSVVCPDAALSEVIGDRHQIYSEIGTVILNWERPRFAPIGGGKHSIVMLDTGPLPIEMDVFIFPESHMETTYKGFGEKGRSFPWEAGEDPTSPDAKLDYLLCASYWALKYISRGEESRAEWLVDRYNKSQAYISGLPPIDITELSTLSPLGQVEHVVSLLHAVDLEDRKKVDKFVYATQLGQAAQRLAGTQTKQEN